LPLKLLFAARAQQAGERPWDGWLEGLGIGRGCGAGSWWRMLSAIHLPIVLSPAGLRFRGDVVRWLTPTAKMCRPLG